STEGLIAVSPCSELAPFFPDSFYLEVNSLEAFEKHQSTNPPTHQSSHPLPAVASFTVHYALPSDRWKYDIVQSIRTLTLLRQHPPKNGSGGPSISPPPAKIQNLFFPHPDLPAPTPKSAPRSPFSSPLANPHFPSSPPADGSPPAAFLSR